VNVLLNTSIKSTSVKTVLRMINTRTEGFQLNLISKAILLEKLSWYVCKTCSHSKYRTTVSFVSKNQSLAAFQILFQKKKMLPLMDVMSFYQVACIQGKFSKT